jgi:hypothetical protein
MLRNATFLRIISPRLIAKGHLALERQMVSTPSAATSAASTAALERPRARGS